MTKNNLSLELEKKEADIADLKEQLRRKDEEKKTIPAPTPQILVPLLVEEKESKVATTSISTSVLSPTAPPVRSEQANNLLSEEEAAPSKQASIDATVELMTSPPSPAKSPAQKEKAGRTTPKAIILKPRHLRNIPSPEQRRVFKLYDEAEQARTTSLMQCKEILFL